MDLNLELERYAAAFSCFLIKKIEKAWLEKINSIILFGSVAQERADRTSDIDLFVDTRLPKSRIRQLRSMVQKIRDEFLLSNDALLYKSSGIYNEISIIAGDLSAWQEMKQSVSAAGIVLYGPYVSSFEKNTLRPSMLFFWEGTGRGRGAFLNKMYGYTIKGKRYSGAIQRLSGTKTGKSAAIIPSENAKAFMKILEKYKVKYRVMEVFV